MSNRASRRAEVTAFRREVAGELLTHLVRRPARRSTDIRSCRKRCGIKRFCAPT